LLFTLLADLKLEVAVLTIDIVNLSLQVLDLLLNLIKLSHTLTLLNVDSLVNSFKLRGHKVPQMLCCFFLRLHVAEARETFGVLLKIEREPRDH
jgi:hypothetical protein